jgi:membrane fusion protein (multidrug efflux system)
MQAVKSQFPALVIIALLSLQACSPGAEEEAQHARAIPLPTIEVSRKSLSSETPYPTRLEGRVNSDVRAKVSGYITEVLVQEGEQVKKGQVLFTLETQSLSQDAEAAKAQVEVAQVEVDKLKPLVEKGIISDIQLQTAKANLTRAKSAYNSVSANIGYARIKSPVDGVIGSINYRKGALVGPADPTPITTVSDIEKIYANFSMNEKEYLDFLQQTRGGSITERIENLPEVNLKLANGQIYEHKGTIETVSGQVNRATGTVSFRVRFDNPTQLLTNGNSGTILIPIKYDSVLVVPETSTFEQQGQTFVYTLSKNNEATPKGIEVLARAHEMVVIQSGIKEGETIIAKGVGKIRNGALIAPTAIPFDEVNTFKTVFK